MTRRAGRWRLGFGVGGPTGAGVPPSTGFLGKLMVLQSAKDATAVAPIWTVIVVTSVLMLAGCARAGSIVLWNVTEPQPREQAHSPRGGEWMALAALAGCSLLLILFAAPVKRYLDETAVQLISPAGYVEAVLGPQQDGLVRPHTVRGAR